MPYKKHNNSGGCMWGRRLLTFIFLCSLSPLSATHEQLAQVLQSSLAGNTQAWQQGTTLLAQKKQEYRVVYSRALQALRDIHGIEKSDEGAILDALAGQAGLKASPAARWQISALLIMALQEQQAVMCGDVSRKRASWGLHVWTFLKKSSWYTLVIAALAAYYGWGLFKKMLPRLIEMLKKALETKEKERGNVDSEELPTVAAAAVVVQGDDPKLASEPDRRLRAVLPPPMASAPRDPILALYASAPAPPPNPPSAPPVVHTQDDSLLSMMQEVGRDMTGWVRQHPMLTWAGGQLGLTLLQPAPTINVDCRVPCEQSCDPGVLVARRQGVIATAPVEDSSFTGRDAAMLAGGAAAVVGANYLLRRDAPAGGSASSPKPPESSKEPSGDRDDMPGDDSGEK